MTTTQWDRARVFPTLSNPLARPFYPFVQPFPSLRLVHTYTHTHTHTLSFSLSLSLSLSILERVAFYSTLSLRRCSLRRFGFSLLATLLSPSIIRHHLSSFLADCRVSLFLSLSLCRYLTKPHARRSTENSRQRPINAISNDRSKQFFL